MKYLPHIILNTKTLHTKTRVCSFLTCGPNAHNPVDCWTRREIGTAEAEEVQMVERNFWRLLNNFVHPKWPKLFLCGQTDVVRHAWTWAPKIQGPSKLDGFVVDEGAEQCKPPSEWYKRCRHLHTLKRILMDSETPVMVLAEHINLPTSYPSCQTSATSFDCLTTYVLDSWLAFGATSGTDAGKNLECASLHPLEDFATYANKNVFDNLCKQILSVDKSLQIALTSSTLLCAIGLTHANLSTFRTMLDIH
jgi:hypothetical protein